MTRLLERLYVRTGWKWVVRLLWLVEGARPYTGHERMERWPWEWTWKGRRS